ncbi:hypothetical protein Ngar_c06200 [Candidatus Nitrososphaera gargensis Ga9.2]|uniref:ArnR1-like winged helix-turn-helix domain-containing protein n=1 Tax=Nitrososphaera gargensis (strain Ga9.2) TaxID=1237085 RepID=K0IFF5_NITGG|nr:hypothetical protein [Candidatus Nitrososphaera gargensis]AFU57563.1 hypothetical protein Ngar_c06200 [Candidatus Nitrososphaera gargensis Ga9.2]
MSSSYVRIGVNTAGFERYTPLQQAIELLQRLEKRSSNAEKLARELGTEENFISHFIRFLHDMQWIRSDNRELWCITEKGGVWLHNIQDMLEDNR